ncbi:MAG: hypothetical protein ABSF70_06950 [Terracidiphilus sp.]|jgi:hypothetical protein
MYSSLASSELISGSKSVRSPRENSPLESETRTSWSKGFDSKTARGLFDVYIQDERSFEKHREYIHNNPVTAGLVNSPEEYKAGSAYLKKQKRAGAEAHVLVATERHD